MLLLCAIERDRDRVGTPSIRVSICLPPEQPGVCLTLLVAVAFGFFFLFFFTSFSKFQHEQGELVGWLRSLQMIDREFLSIRACRVFSRSIHIHWKGEEKRGERSVFFIKINNIGFTLGHHTHHVGSPSSRARLQTRQEFADGLAGMRS